MLSAKPAVHAGVWKSPVIISAAVNGGGKPGEDFLLSRDQQAITSAQLFTKLQTQRIIKIEVTKNV